MNSYEQEQIQRIKTVAKRFMFGAVALFTLIVVLGSFYVIDAGERGVVLRFGEVKSVESEGLHWKFPLVESVKKFSVRTDKIEREAGSASKDLQIVTTQIALNYQLDATQIDRIYREFETKNIIEAKLIDPAIQDAVKASTARFNAEELVTKRSEVKESMENDLKQRLQSSGIIVSNMNIVNFQFSNEFDQSIEAKVTAEQNALKAENDLKRIQFESQQRIVQAEGEAEAIRIQAEAVNSQGGADYVELQRIQKWNGQACTSYCGLETSNGLLIQR